jgi:two-component system alkaline phosphatase synthesis response regulator PhoP
MRWRSRAARQPDLIVLDLGLPQMDGLDVTRALRRQSNVPIIMLTARVDESDTLIGLELGRRRLRDRSRSARRSSSRACARCSGEWTRRRIAAASSVPAA